MTTTFGIAMAESGDEFVPPGPNSFDFSAVPLFHLGEYAVTKPLVQLLLGGLVVFLFFYAASRRVSLVPGRSSSPARAPTASCATRSAATPSEPDCSSSSPT